MIARKQIGWSNESNLLWDISNQLDRLTKVTASNTGVGGGGTTNFLAKWINSTTLGDSILHDDGVFVGIGTTVNAGYKLDVNGVVRALNSNFEAGSSTADTFQICYRVIRNGVSIGVIDNFVGDIRLRAQNNNGARVTNTAGDGIIVRNSGNVLIGTTLENTSAILFISSTTQGVRLPAMTTTEINNILTPVNGLTVYNTTLTTLCFFNGTQWRRVSNALM
jgi:hypothetical protein